MQLTENIKGREYISKDNLVSWIIDQIDDVLSSDMELEHQIEQVKAYESILDELKLN